MKVDLSKTSPSTPVTPVVEVESTATPVETSGPTGVSVPATTRPGGAGDFIQADHLPGFKDIILPRLNIVQFIGELKDTFNPGEIVFNQNLVLFNPPNIDKQTGTIKTPASPPLNLTVIGFRPTRYVEKVTGGGRGLICNTEADVTRAGGTLDYNEWELKKAQGMKRFEYLAEAFVAIRRPEAVADDDSVFTYDVGGVKYALALWAMKGTHYTHAAKKVFFTARQMGCLKNGGYPSWSFSVSTRTKTDKGNTYYIPVVLPDKPSTPAFLEFVRAILQSPETTSSEE